jgi:hypothetical protein
MSQSMPQSVTLPPRLDEALKRLTSALDQLDAAVARRAESDEARGNLDEELAVMQDDRSRLAVELDAALARTRALSLANDEARERLTKTAETLRAILGPSDEDAGGGKAA